MPDASFEEKLKHRTLDHILYVVMGSSAALGLLNVFLAYSPGAVSLFLLSGFCLFLVWLNRVGWYSLSAGILCAVILAAMHYNFRVGSGLRDSGIIAYPGLVTLGALLFGKRTAPLFFAACAASILVLTRSHLSGEIAIPMATDLETATKILIVLLACTSLTYIVAANIEKYLERVRQSRQDIHAAYELTLEGWARALEYRDKETEGHSRRVAEMSVRLARELGCADEDLEQIRRGALLHDIGKLAIPDHILLKPDSLTEEERQVMRQHPVYAREILAPIAFLTPAISIPFSHHERWDGTGYPQGLKGEEIPLFARLFAVVDQWEALSSDRPYRKAWPPERIREHLQKNAGVMFDPKIVEAFLRILG